MSADEISSPHTLYQLACIGLGKRWRLTLRAALKYKSGKSRISSFVKCLRASSESINWTPNLDNQLLSCSPRFENSHSTHCNTAQQREERYHGRSFPLAMPIDRYIDGGKSAYAGLISAMNGTPVLQKALTSILPVHLLEILHPLQPWPCH